MFLLQCTSFQDSSEVEVDLRYGPSKILYIVFCFPSQRFFIVHRTVKSWLIVLFSKAPQQAPYRAFINFTELSLTFMRCLFFAMQYAYPLMLSLFNKCECK